MIAKASRFLRENKYGTLPSELYCKRSKKTNRVSLRNLAQYFVYLISLYLSSKAILRCLCLFSLLYPPHTRQTGYTTTWPWPFSFVHKELTSVVTTPTVVCFHLIGRLEPGCEAPALNLFTRSVWVSRGPVFPQRSTALLVKCLPMYYWLRIVEDGQGKPLLNVHVFSEVVSKPAYFGTAVLSKSLYYCWCFKSAIFRQDYKGVDFPALKKVITILWY